MNYYKQQCVTKDHADIVLLSAMNEFGWDLVLYSSHVYTLSALIPLGELPF